MQLETLNRTLLISGKEYGTAFTLDVDKKQYVVTCRHVTDGTTPKILWDGEFSDIGLTLIGQTDEDVDIAVFAAGELLSNPSLTLPWIQKGVFLGQDLWFAGFPLAPLYQDQPKANAGLPLPFVKKSILSAFGDQDDKRLWYLDGHVNQGFSGGPVVTAASPNQIAAVMTHAQNERNKIYMGEQELAMVCHTNAGFALARPIHFALELIRKNPNGYAIDVFN